ncbi:MAG: hypothetical protein RJA98_2496 [Pseudomonadota bacterium]|jgi:hypothetical protein
MALTALPLEPLLSGTLALMSAFQQADPCPQMAGRIAANLARLAADRHLSDPCRTVMTRLAAQWQARDGTALDATPLWRSTSTSSAASPAPASITAAH